MPKPKREKRPASSLSLVMVDAALACFRNAMTHPVRCAALLPVAINFTRGMRAYGRSDYTKAADLLERTIAVQPVNPLALETLAKCQRKLKRDTEARHTLRKAARRRHKAKCACTGKACRLG